MWFKLPRTKPAGATLPTPPEFDLPDVWRAAPGEGQSKQGSGERYNDAKTSIHAAVR